MKRRKSIIALLLCASMVFGTTMTAFAQDEAVDTEATITEEAAVEVIEEETEEVETEVVEAEEPEDTAPVEEITAEEEPELLNDPAVSMSIIHDAKNSDVDTYGMMVGESRSYKFSIENKGDDITDGSKYEVQLSATDGLTLSQTTYSCPKNWMKGDYMDIATSYVVVKPCTKENLEIIVSLKYEGKEVWADSLVFDVYDVADGVLKYNGTSGKKYYGVTLEADSTVSISALDAGTDDIRYDNGTAYYLEDKKLQIAIETDGTTKITKVDLAADAGEFNENTDKSYSSGTRQDWYVTLKSPVTIKVTTEGIKKGSWMKSNNRWWYRFEDGTYPKNTILTIQGKVYGFDESGWMVTGWKKLDGEWYYFGSQGDGCTGWIKDGTKWYYCVDGLMYHDQFVEYNGVYYGLNSDGSMATGWYKYDNGMQTDWYYFGTDGKPFAGWSKIKGVWYLLSNVNSSNGYKGRMLTGWHDSKGKSYYLDPVSGAMATGWKKIGGEWYYFNASGAAQSGWIELSSTWYYLDKTTLEMYHDTWFDNDCYYFTASGAMATGWTKISDKYYYFEKTGEKAVNKWIDDTYYVKSNGERAISEWVDKDRYYVDENGKKDTTKKKES